MTGLRAVIGIGIWTAVAGLVMAGGCGRRHAAESEAGRAAEAPIRVPVHRVAALGGGDEILLPGRIEAREEVTVAARLAARLTRLPVAEGGSFARGAVLAEFDAPETREGLIAARARAAAAALRRDQARLQEARMDSLAAGRVAALRELELAQADRRAAEAEHAAAGAALAELEAATRVPAPFDGVVVRRRVDPGASVGPGTPLLDIRSREPGWIVAPIPESLAPDVAGARASFQVGGGPFREAVLERLDGMTDFTTRTRTARFRPAGPAGAAGLEPGAFARVRIAGAGAGAAGLGPGPGTGSGSGPGTGSGSGLEAGAVRVPMEAVVRRGGLTGVYVVREGRAALRWIRLGAENGDMADVLAGLVPGEQVALEPWVLSDGRAVEVAP